MHIFECSLWMKKMSQMVVSPCEHVLICVQKRACTDDLNEREHTELHSCHINDMNEHTMAKIHPCHMHARFYIMHTCMHACTYIQACLFVCLHATEHTYRHASLSVCMHIFTGMLLRLFARNRWTDRPTDKNLFLIWRSQFASSAIPFRPMFKRLCLFSEFLHSSNLVMLDPFFPCKETIRTLRGVQVL